MKSWSAALALAFLIGSIVPSQAAWETAGNRVGGEPAVIPFGTGVLLFYGALGTGVVRAVDSTGVTAPGWPAEGVVVTLPGSSYGNRHLAAAPDGGAYALWTNANASPDEIRIQRLTDNGAIFPGWPAGGRVVATACPHPWCSNYFSSTVETAPDGSGGLYVAFRIDGNGDEYHLTHVTDTGAIASGWPANGVSFGSYPEAIGPVALAADGAGGVFHASRRSGGSPDSTIIRRFRSDGTQDPAWPAGGARLAFSPTSSYAVISMFPDALGGVLLVCQKQINCGSYCPSIPAIATRLTASGQVATGWPAAGRSLGTLTSVVPDGSGGLLTASWYGWVDRALRFDANALVAPGWVSPGNPLCDANGLQAPAFIAADGQGGLFAAWVDSRNPEEAIYGTRLSPDGSIAPGWLAAGSLSAPGSTPVWLSKLVMSGSGDPIVIWADTRTDTTHFYMKPLMPESPPLDVEPDRSAAFGITGVHPNPASGRFSVTMAVPDPSPATLELVDLSGRVIESHSHALPGPARGSVWFDVPERLPAGVYWVRLRQGARTATARVVRIR